jgi:hypothetical protein
MVLTAFDFLDPSRKYVILFPNVNCPKIAIQREMERRGLKGVKV